MKSIHKLKELSQRA